MKNKKKFKKIVEYEKDSTKPMNVLLPFAVVYFGALIADFARSLMRHDDIVFGAIAGGTIFGMIGRKVDVWWEEI